MSAFGGPIPAGVAGASGAQESVSRARDRKERQQADASRRLDDAVELRVAGAESAEAIHGVAGNDSEEARHDHERRELPGREDAGRDDHPSLDVTG